MLEWIGALPAMAVALLVLFVPGLAVAWVLALRGIALAAAAPVLTVGLGALLAVGYGVLGVGWTPFAASLGFAIVVAVLWGLRRLFRLGTLTTPARGPRWALPVGIVAGALILLAVLTRYIGAPDAISQTNDAVFHLNAVRYAVDTGEASSLLINGVQGARGFYPAAWHGLVSLVTQLGVDMSVAVNHVALVLSCVVWPLGCAWLALATMRSRLIAGIAGVTAAGFATFPLLLLQWGVLYPLHASLAVLPAAVALWASAAEWARPAVEGATGPSGAAAGRVLRVAGLLGLSAAGVALAQPATLLPLFLAVLLVAAGRVLAGWREATIRRRISGAVAVVLGAGAVGLAWYVLGSLPSSGHWPATLGRAEAAQHVVAQAFLGAPARLALAVLVLIGIVRALLRPDARWLIVLWGLLGVLYVAAIALYDPELRSLLVGAWYEDPYRLAALTTLASVPLAALGAETIARVIVRVARARERLVAPLATATALLVVVPTVILVPPVFMNVVFEGPPERPNPYRVDDANYLEDDERALLEELPDLIPEDATVIGNPGTGMGFGYALTGMDVIPRTWQLPRGIREMLGTRLPEAADDPEVCEMVEQLGVDYVLDFGPGIPYPGRWVLPGFTDFEDRDGFELVAVEGDASIWEITACD